MKIIFLIAGRGSRLKSLTKKHHKSLLKIDKVPIIRRLVNLFLSLKIKTEDVTFITGYKHEQIRSEFGKKFKYFYYKDFLNTNNLHTLVNAKKVIKNDDTIICFSDILTNKNTISKIVDSKITKITILSDLSKVRNGTMKVLTNKNNLKFIGKILRKKASGNYVGIMKIPKKKITIFKNYLTKSKNKNKNLYFTEVLNDLIKHKEKINVMNIAPNYWTEIDNLRDLRTAKKNINKLVI